MNNPPTLWYAFRYMPRRWRLSLAEALVWGGHYVMSGAVEHCPHAQGGVRGVRFDNQTRERWYHHSWLDRYERETALATPENGG